MSDPFVVVNPPQLDKPRGFAHGMLAPATGRLLFVAGQVGIDPPSGAPGGFMEQFDRALARVLTVVRAAGGRPEQIVRMTVYVTNMATYRNSRPPLRDVWRRHLGSHYPAMAIVEVSGLFDARAVVEIEATAVLP